LPLSSRAPPLPPGAPLLLTINCNDIGFPKLLPTPLQGPYRTPPQTPPLPPLINDESHTLPDIDLAFLPTTIVMGALSLGFAEKLIMRFGACTTVIPGVSLDSDGVADIGVAAYRRVCAGFVAPSLLGAGEAAVGECKVVRGMSPSGTALTATTFYRELVVRGCQSSPLGAAG
jgi:hypothetical protein